MNERTLRAVMEEISATAMMADVADHESLEALIPLFDELRPLAAGASSAFSEGADAAFRRLTLLLDGPNVSAASSGKSKKGRKPKTDSQAALFDPEETLQQFLLDLDRLQKLLDAPPRPSQPPAVNAPTSAAPEASNKGGAIVLPDWVEQATLDEYISSQLASLDELEAEILALEKGGPDRLATLKRRLHTMKGEAGVVGLDPLAHVCHAVEDFLDLPMPIEEQVARLLQVKDWIAQTVEAYAVLEHPETPAETVMAMLRAPAPAPLHRVAVPAAPSAPTLAAMREATPAERKEEPFFASVSEGLHALDDHASVPLPPPSAVPAAPVSTPFAAAGSAPPAPHWDAETIEMVGEFLAEALEGLAHCDQALLTIEQDGATADLVNGLFRNFHNIKGTSGFYELTEITRVAHATETLLDRVRGGKLELQGQVLDAVLDATELTRALLDNVRNAISTGGDVASSDELGDMIAVLVAATEGRLPPAEPVAPATPGARLGEILVRRGSVKPAEMASALQAQQTSGLRLGEQLVAEGVVRPKEVAEALRSQKASGAQAAVIKETIRIDVDRVDSLVEMIGELVIVQSLVSNMTEIQGISSLKARTYLGQLTKITRDLQGVGLRMRMMPVRGVFQKMSRMVHDLSRKSGKEVRIVLSGEDVEMDRGMVDLLGDPLVHMIRNAVDHGIESAEDRKKTDKPAVATVRLSAFHECGNIAIEVADDGRGLNRDAILAKARAQGIVPPGVEPSDPEIFALIFAPGFSTAKQVTEISGRGVGMDVVKRQIESMRGRVMISSTPGRGASFKLVLPLTLAIIDGMLIACGEERYIIPTLSIVESIQPQATQLFSSPNRGEILNLRGEILPLVRLDRMLDIPNAKQDPTQALVVVLDSFGHRLGLVVDDVLTKQQVVIKSLGAELQGNHFVSGAAILGDGRVGFILNVQEIGRLFGDAHRNAGSGGTKPDSQGDTVEA